LTSGIPDGEPKRTTLNARHRALGAKMVPFGGWEMPLQYSGIVEEHHAVRKAAGIFDVSHMGKVWITGPGAESLVSRIQTNLPAPPGRGAYGHILDESGRIIDDTIVYNLSAGSPRFLCIPNAATKDRVLEWFRKHAAADVEFRDATESHVCLALQGPKAQDILRGVSGLDVSGMKFMDARIVDFHGREAVLTRSGYTGEDGFELVAANQEGEQFWSNVLSAGKPAGLLPCGLGARDTLRMEKAFLLSGQDFHGDRTPLETNASWVVKWDHDFVGKAALEKQKQEGVKERFRGIATQERRAIPRHGSKVRLPGGEGIGTVTSGTFSPTLEKGIGLGYFRSDVKAGPVEVEVRGSWNAAEMVKTPFV
jgi:aminomethyltransferase